MVIWAAVAGVVLATVLACAAGLIKPNHGIGLRIPATQRSETAWRVGHRAAVPAAATGTTAIVIAVIVSFADPGSASTMMIVAGAVLVAELIWMVLAAHRAASRVSVHHP